MWSPEEHWRITIEFLLLLQMTSGLILNDTLLQCSMGIDNTLSVNFTIPQDKPQIEDITFYYKSENEKTWSRLKSYKRIGVSEVRDSIEIHTEPNTLYQGELVFGRQRDFDITDIIAACEFCSHTESLEGARELGVQAAGPDWLALVWEEAARACPRRVSYEITYHDGAEPPAWQEWRPGPAEPLVLAGGLRYARLARGLRPATAYVVCVVLIAEEGRKFRSKMAKLTATTLPSPDPPMMTQPPVILKATNSSLTVSAKTDCQYQCTATWEYKEPSASEWRVAGNRRVVEPMEIAGLNATTVYQVRALLQRDSDCQPFASDKVPLVDAATLPVAEPKVYEYPPVAVNATNTSLTLITDCGDECKGYIAHWEYKEDNETEWHYVGAKFVHYEMNITGLKPHTMYNVRFNLQWPNGSRTFNHSEYYQETMTCANAITPVRYGWAHERQRDMISVTWSHYDDCSFRRYLLRWKAYGTLEDADFPRTGLDARNCPPNATLVTHALMHDCGYHDFCFTVRDLAPGTRYVFEITAMDTEGECSDSETVRTSTPWILWGGISVGQWSLIVLGLIFLVMACVATFVIVKKKLNIRLVEERNVTFRTADSTSADGNEETHGDADRIILPDPVTRIRV